MAFYSLSAKVSYHVNVLMSNPSARQERRISYSFFHDLLRVLYRNDTLDWLW